MENRWFLLLLLSLIFPIFNQPEAQVPIAATYQLGIASWYSETDPGINRHTANGEIFDDSGLTCASWYFPFNTELQVTNVQNKKTVICRVNDRGPAKRLGRVIDLTKTSFARIAPLKKGLIEVRIQITNHQDTNTKQIPITKIQ